MALVAAGVATGCGGSEAGFVDAGAVHEPARGAPTIAASPALNRSTAEAENVRFDKPKLLVVRAAWCPACRRIEPVLKQAFEAYEGKVELVVLDVTDEDSTTNAKRRADTEGVAKIYERAAGRTPTILVALGPDEVIQPDGPPLQTSTYAQALDAALQTKK